jgi:hypothetical protein
VVHSLWSWSIPFGRWHVSGCGQDRIDLLETHPSNMRVIRFLYVPRYSSVLIPYSLVIRILLGSHAMSQQTRRGYSGHTNTRHSEGYVYCTRRSKEKINHQLNDLAGEKTSHDVGCGSPLTSCVVVADLSPSCAVGRPMVHCTVPILGVAFGHVHVIAHTRCSGPSQWKRPRQ